MMDVKPDKRMEEVDEKETLIYEALGAEEAWTALCRAMSYDDKRELFDYIIRVYDLQG